MIDTADRRGDRGEWATFEWEDARIEVLDTLTRGDEAQADRWSCFERALSIPHLRAYLKRLPDFEDVDAEERALDYAERYTSPIVALAFLVSWPALDRAAALAIRQAGDLDGHRYEILAPAAEALTDTDPLAATLVLRSMIDAALTQRRSSRYHHAARHLRECASLPGVGDQGFRGLRRARCLRRQITPGTREEELVLARHPVRHPPHGSDAWPASNRHHGVPDHRGPDTGADTQRRAHGVGAVDTVRGVAQPPRNKAATPTSVVLVKDRRCCTNRPRPARCPLTGSSPADAI